MGGMLVSLTWIMDQGNSGKEDLSLERFVYAAEPKWKLETFPGMSTKGFYRVFPSPTLIENFISKHHVFCGIPGDPVGDPRDPGGTQRGGGYWATKSPAGSPRARES